MNDIEFRSCQFCRKSADTDDLVKYGVRHYAHFGCYLEAGKSLDDLHAWQVRQFPFKLLRERGLLEQVDQIEKRDAQRERDYEARVRGART